MSLELVQSNKSSKDTFFGSPSHNLNFMLEALHVTLWIRYVFFIVEWEVLWTCFVDKVMGPT
jgi:hypothetical protein